MLYFYHCVLLVGHCAAKYFVTVIDMNRKIECGRFLWCTLTCFCISIEPYHLKRMSYCNCEIQQWGE